MDTTADHQAKPIWNLLLIKAQNQVRQAQMTLSNCHRQRQQAQLRVEKIDQLLVEYSQHLSDVQQQSQSRLETGNYRQFILQLQALRSQAKSALVSLEEACQQARDRLQTADGERLKVESMVERKADQQRRVIASRQAKSLEADNIRRYQNTKSNSVTGMGIANSSGKRIDQ